MQVPITGQSVTITAEDPADGLEIGLRLRPGSELAIQTLGGAADTVFRLSDGVWMTRAGTGRLEIDLPGTVSHILVTVDGESRWIMEDGRARRVPPSSGVSDGDLQAGMRGG